MLGFIFARLFLKQAIDLVAQLVEHNTFNVGVLGSSPSGITVLILNSLIYIQMSASFSFMGNIWETLRGI